MAQARTPEMFRGQKSLPVDDGLDEELPRLQSNPTEMLAQSHPKLRKHCAMPGDPRITTSPESLSEIRLRRNFNPDALWVRPYEAQNICGSALHTYLHRRRQHALQNR